MKDHPEWGRCSCDSPGQGLLAVLGVSSAVAWAEVLGYGAAMLGGSDLLVYLVGALGAAMLVGNVAALLRPPARAKAGDLPVAPRGRTVTMAVVGALACLWAMATLFTR